MSVPKGRRTISPVQYFESAYDLVEKITKYLISDFGTKRTYNNLFVFSNKAKMTQDDKEVFEEIANKYHLDIETAYSYWLLEHYRDRILSIMDSLISNISFAHTMYPNSVYEFNIRRQYQTDAISNCYDLKHTLQLAIKIMPANLEKYIPLVKLVDEEIGYLKTWRKDSNKFKKTCYSNDEKYRRDAATREASRAARVSDSDFIFNFLAGMTVDISKETLINNFYNHVPYYDQNGALNADRLTPAVVFENEKGDIIGDGVHR